MKQIIWPMKGSRGKTRLLWASVVIALVTLPIVVACTHEQASNPPVPAPTTPATTAPATTAPNPTVAATTPTVLTTGSFVQAEHPTQGGVRIVEENGSRYLELDDAFRTDAGPDLVVLLHRQADILGGSQPPAYSLQAKDYVELGELQNPSGAQRYVIPADLDLADYASVAVWCRQFNATFGVATLQ